MEAAHAEESAEIMTLNEIALRKQERRRKGRLDAGAKGKCPGAGGAPKQRIGSRIPIPHQQARTEVMKRSG